MASAPVAILLALGLAVAFLLTPSWATPYEEPATARMTSIQIEVIERADSVGQAQGFLDGSYSVPGGTVWYGWVVWPNPDDPILLTTTTGLGPGVAQDREDVLASIGPQARRAGFQILWTDPEPGNPPCLMVSSDTGPLALGGTENGC